MASYVMEFGYDNNNTDGIGGAGAFSLISSILNTDNSPATPALQVKFKPGDTLSFLVCDYSILPDAQFQIPSGFTLLLWDVPPYENIQPFLPVSNDNLVQLQLVQSTNANPSLVFPSCSQIKAWDVVLPNGLTALTFSSDVTKCRYLMTVQIQIGDHCWEDDPEIFVGVGDPTTL